MSIIKPNISSTQEYAASLPKVEGREVDEIMDNGAFRLSFIYADEYRKNPKNFIVCFIKFQSIKSTCAFIVHTYKRKGVFAELQENGKDFHDYAAKVQVDEKWKKVLEEILLILYSIINV